MFRCLNIVRLDSKLDDLLEVRRDQSIDVLLLTESWHDSNSVCLQPTVSQSSSALVFMPELTLNTNHGGVVVAVVPGVRLTAVDLNPKLTLFEAVCACVSVASTHYVVLLIYRPGSVAVTSEFFTEFAETLDVLSTLAATLIVAGDINVRRDRPADPATVQLSALLASRGLSGCVSDPTHDRGGLLDIVATRDYLPTSSVNVIDIGRCPLHVRSPSTRRPSVVLGVRWTSTACGRLY